MKNRLMNRVVNKYILHNRSIFFENDDEVEQFLEKRRDENSKKHKQPSSLNVKANLDKLSLGDMQVFRFNFRHETKKKILYIHGGYNTLQPSTFHWRLMDKLALNTYIRSFYRYILKHQSFILKIHLKQLIMYMNRY